MHAGRAAGLPSFARSNNNREVRCFSFSVCLTDDSRLRGETFPAVIDVDDNRDLCLMFHGKIVG